MLPNDQTLVLKAFGKYHVTQHLNLGVNVLVQSPRHGSCMGHHPTDPNATGYGASSFHCAYGPLNADGVCTSTRPSPRGTGYTTDWISQVDLSFLYELSMKLFNDKFVLRADVFSVFNAHAVSQQNAARETQRIVSRSDRGVLEGGGTLVPPPFLSV